MRLGLAWYALAKRPAGAVNPFIWMAVTLPGGELFAPQQMPAFPAVLLFWSLLFPSVVTCATSERKRNVCSAPRR
ncbi:MAG TPA: hypothetical protein VFO94_18315 [Gammaproteobacteria bacterium]|nr:hypothetical protein [Gammaproteobacteria bacterium]